MAHIVPYFPSVLMGRIGTSSRYVIAIIGTDPFSLEELGGGGVNLEKSEKLRYYNLITGDRILMKFDT